MIAAAQTIGSMHRCGIAPCPPLPWTVMTKFDFALISPPDWITTCPAGTSGRLCIPKKYFGEMIEKSPASIISWQPFVVSSAS